MEEPLLVSSHRKSQVASTVDELRAMLSSPDGRGGGSFWLSTEKLPFPCLAIRVSDGQCDVHFFPFEGHPGFRRLSSVQRGGDEHVVLRFEGCDPHDGEETPAEFALPLSEGLDIASAFMRERAISDPEHWYEL